MQNRSVFLLVELLISHTTNLQRSESRDTKNMIFDGKTVSFYDKGLFPFAVSGYLRFCFELLRMLFVLLGGLENALPVILQHNQSPLSGCCGRHPAVERVVVLFEALIDFSVIHDFMLEESLTQLVVTTVVEGTGMETRLFTSREKGVISADSDFLYTHGPLENCLQFKVYYGFLGFPQRETGYLRPYIPALRYGVLRAF